MTHRRQTLIIVLERGGICSHQEQFCERMFCLLLLVVCQASPASRIHKRVRYAQKRNMIHTRCRTAIQDTTSFFQLVRGTRCTLRKHGPCCPCSTVLLLIPGYPLVYIRTGIQVTGTPPPWHHAAVKPNLVGTWNHTAPVFAPS